MNDQNVFVPTNEDVNLELRCILTVILDNIKELHRGSKELYIKASALEETINRRLEKYGELLDK